MTNAGINGFAVEFYHSIKKELTSTFLKLFYKKKKKKCVGKSILPNSFYKNIVTDAKIG